ncbi:MAG TPA: phosphoglycerate kinase [Methanothermococcus okinawensis]|uniref:Phosphoglycerate kinase n=1 Tax=Methanofervidicoccus abyssi TaxID=2082189 RepID=A0A401HRG8_9EURY|nr:phosphoglycerate kinase [Methanofervidicoccus abyssi]GBF36731.1 phosphoglycerate kinase [Methanofervidicoccus abyssi]HIP16148.1 phosphoglycerate kinase [Methanothermococcus okinawensis]
MFLTMDDFDFKGKRVALRVDINSPMDVNSYTILDDTRIRACKDTIEELSGEGAKVVILAHQSRPGKKDFTPLYPHAKKLSEILGRDVEYVDDLFGSHALNTIERMEDGDIVILENVRFYSEEVLKDWNTWNDSFPKKQGKTIMIKKLYPYFDYFINDAFAAAHRAQPSLVGLAYYMPAIAGRIMEKEIKVLSKTLEDPDKPSIFILGGAKADDSIEVIKNVLKNNSADKVLTTGIVANIFLIAKGYDLGPNRDTIADMGYLDLIEVARNLLDTYGDRIEVPVDVALNVNGERKEVKLDIGERITYSIYDIGSETVEHYDGIIKEARTIVANGPAGVFENKNFLKGTAEILKSMVRSRAFTVIGGGHLSAAASIVGVADRIDHISTGGGACIQFLAGKKLPVIEILKKSYREYVAR